MSTYGSVVKSNSKCNPTLHQIQLNRTMHQHSSASEPHYQDNFLMEGENGLGM